MRCVITRSHAYLANVAMHHNRRATRRAFQLARSIFGVSGTLTFVGLRAESSVPNTPTSVGRRHVRLRFGRIQRLRKASRGRHWRSGRWWHLICCFIQHPRSRGRPRAWCCASCSSTSFTATAASSQSSFTRLSQGQYECSFGISLATSPGCGGVIIIRGCGVVGPCWQSHQSVARIV